MQNALLKLFLDMLNSLNDILFDNREYITVNKIRKEVGQCSYINQLILPFIILITYDFSELERNKRGNIDWVKSVGKPIYFNSLNKNGSILLLDTTRYKTNTKLLIKYNDKTKWVFTSELKDKNWCDFLNVYDDTSSMKRTKKLKYKIHDNIFDEKVDFTVIDYFTEQKKINTKNMDGSYRIKNSYKYLLRCNKCGYDRLVRSERQIKNICPVCCKSPQIVVKGINDIPTTNPELIDFFPGGIEEASKYTKSSNKKIIPKCNICGRLSNKKYQINQLNKYGRIQCNCRGVGGSYWERYVYEFLCQLNIKFDYHARFSWCKYFNPYKNKISFGEYDFSIESLKLIIETDGTFHRTQNNMSGQTVEESEFLDCQKDKLAKQNGYTVIRLICEGSGILKGSSNIIKKEILKNTILREIISKNKINWNKCDIYASSNTILDICNEYNRGEYDLSKIGEKYNISKTTVLNYLHKGTDIGVCKYNPNIYRIQKQNEWAETRRKRVIVYDINKRKINIYSSRYELEEKSINEFGIKFLYGGITKSCLTGKSYKNHYFEFQE